MIDLTKSVEEISAELISIHSVIRNEKEICDSIEETLLAVGADVKRHSNSLVCRLNFDKEKTIALVGHIDTVPLTRENQTTPEFKDGYLWGLGSADMKSGVACMLKIFQEIHEEKITPTKNLTLVFYESEEGPLPNGMNILLDAKALGGIDFAYILEPTECRYSVGCLGALTVKKEIKGISAHSANPRTGKNAITESMEIYNRICEADKEISKDQTVLGLPFYETINVTQLTTENASNVIPQSCFMTINFRFAPGRSVDNAEQFIYDLIGGEEGVFFVDRSPSCVVEKGLDEFLLDGVEQEIMQAWTDIAQLNGAGIPAVNYGAGSIKVAHKPDERISLEELRGFYKKLVEHL